MDIDFDQKEWIESYKRKKKYGSRKSRLVKGYWRKRRPGKTYG